MNQDSIMGCQAIIAALKAKRHYLSNEEFDCGLRIQQLIKEQSIVEEELMSWTLYLEGVKENKPVQGTLDKIRRRLAI